MASVSKTGNRTRILAHIHAHPGIHRSALHGRVGLAWGTVNHHVHALSRRRQIHIVRIGQRTHLIPASTGDHAFGAAALSMPLSRKIIAALRANPWRGREDLAKHLDAGHRTLQTHLDNLAKAGIIQTNQAYHQKWALVASEAHSDLAVNVEHEPLDEADAQDPTPSSETRCGTS